MPSSVTRTSWIWSQPVTSYFWGPPLNYKGGDFGYTWGQKSPSGAGMDGKGDTSPGKLFAPCLSITLGTGTDPLDAGPPFSHYPGEVGGMGIFLPLGRPGSPAFSRTLQICPRLPVVPPVPPWSQTAEGYWGRCFAGWQKQGGTCVMDTASLGGLRGNQVPCFDRQ